jgi:hypothetical protein
MVGLANHVGDVKVRPVIGGFNIDCDNRPSIRRDNRVVFPITLGHVGVGKPVFIEVEHLTRSVRRLEFCGDGLHPTHDHRGCVGFESVGARVDIDADVADCILGVLRGRHFSKWSYDLDVVSILGNMSPSGNVEADQRSRNRAQNPEHDNYAHNDKERFQAFAGCRS